MLKIDKDSTEDNNLLGSYYLKSKITLIKTKAGIKIARKNINNLRHADNSTLMAESEEELKSLLMRVNGVKKQA